MRKNILRAVVLIPLLLAAATPLGAADQEFDPDRALRDPAFANALKTIDSQDSARQAFEQHGVRAFGISNQLIGFLDELAGGQYTTQISELMDMPVQQWNANRGMYGSYELVNVKQIVNRNQTTSLFGSVKDAMGHVATAVSCVQVGRDIAKGIRGDDPAKLNAIHGTYNIVVGFSIKEFGLQSLGTAMMGVAFLGTALTEFQSAAQQHYEDYWWIAYSNYLENKYPQLVTGPHSWAALAESQGNAGIRNRLYEFWNNPYVNAAENYGRASIQTAPDLAQRTLADKFAALYYRNSVHSTLKTYFTLEAEKAEVAAWMRGREEWRRMQALLNDAEQLRLAIQDFTGENEEGLRDLVVAPVGELYREGDTVEFTATAIYGDGTETDVTALCEWNNDAPGGVVANAAGSSVSAAAEFAERTTVGVAALVPMTDLVGAPDPALLKPGEGVTFSATATWEDGVSRDVSAEVEWPGDIPGGRYEGSLEPGRSIWRPVWRGAGFTVSAEILPPTSLNVNPALSIVRPGDDVTFTVEALYETGETVDVTAEVSWSGDASSATFHADEVGLKTIEAEYQQVTGTAQVDVTAPDEMVVTPAGADLKLGESIQFTATVRWPDGEVEDVTAQMDWGPLAPGGLFTAREEGIHHIAVEHHHAGFTVTVQVVGALSLTLSPASSSIRMNETVQLTAMAEFEWENAPVDVTPYVTFSGCSADGLFTPTTTGTSTVTATYGEQSAAATVEVMGPDQLFLEPGDSTIDAGETVSFTATAHFPDGSIDDVTATTAFTNAPGGVFSGTTPGRTTVTAAYGGLSATANVTVEQGATLSLSPASAECEVGGTVSFTARLQRPDGTAEDVSGRVSWQGADGGTFTGRVPGETVVTANLGGLTAAARVAVEDGDADVTLDDAVDDIGDEDVDELCTAAEMRAAAARVRALLGDADAAYASFQVFSLKFDKELADRAADPCGNSLLAYCWAGARDAATDLSTAVAGLREAATTLLSMKAWCPEVAAQVDDGFDSQSMISELAAVGAQHGEVQGRLGEMIGRLGEYGCDENSMEQLGESITEQGMDPDQLQDGGGMQEIGGDGVDNDSDGLQEENVEALSGYNVTIVVYDSGNLKDDVFHLSVTGVGNLGSTPAGGLRSYGLNLPPGTYTATVTVVAAPDNVGTFTVVVMENGETIGSGSGEPPVGSAHTVTFTVTGSTEE